MKNTTRLTRLLTARTAAVIGGREAGIVIDQLQKMGFAGEIWPVNPGRAEITGLACHASLGDLPRVPDVAFVGIPREATIEQVAGLAAMGAGGAVCYASGFAEVGEEGRDFERQLIEAAGDMPIIGPNCYGFINYLDRVVMWPDAHGGAAVERGVAIVSQSGNMAVNFTMQHRGLPLAGVYSLGNQAQVGMAEMVEALAHDPRVSAIGLHIEGLGDIADFARTAETARLTGTPLVALKTGRSEVAARITESHTSSLAGPDGLYDALFARLGVARVHSLTALLETLKLLHFGGPLGGNEIASMSCSGGEAALVADLAEPLGLQFPELAPEHAQQVRETLNDYVDVANPLDYHTFIWGDDDALEACFGAMLEGGFDATMLILDFPNRDHLDASPWLLASRAMIRAAATRDARALIVATLPECMPIAISDEIAATGFAPMIGLDDCLAAIASAAAIGKAWADGPVTWSPALASISPNTKTRTLDENAAKTLLYDAGIAVPRGRVCLAEDAPDAADEIRYPLVLKAVSETLAHKSEAGGVQVGLTDHASLEAALTSMAHLGDRFLIEEMIGDGVAEVIVGIASDQQFGISLVLGSGGVLTELVADSATLLLPATEEDVRKALSGLKVMTLLNGYRGKAAGDIDALVEAVLAIGRFALHHRDTLLALDVNPLIVRPVGSGVCAADAWMEQVDT